MPPAHPSQTWGRGTGKRKRRKQEGVGGNLWNGGRAGGPDGQGSGARHQHALTRASEAQEVKRYGARTGDCVWWGLFAVAGRSAGRNAFKQKDGEARGEDGRFVVRWGIKARFWLH